MAGTCVEGHEFIVVVDVQPFASRPLRVFHGDADQLGPDPVPLQIRSDLGVDEERVVASIPSDVDKAGCSAIAEASCHPPEAVTDGFGPTSPPQEYRHTTC